MSRPIRVAVALALALWSMLVGVAWSLMSPPASSPDEDYHLASIWCPRPLETSGCQLGTIDGKPAVYVPEVFAQRPCYVGKLFESAACQATLSETKLVPSARVDTGDYPGPYYRVMHALIRPGVDSSVITMRVVNVGIAVALIGAALALATAESRRASGYALLAAVAPIGTFVVASVNPSSWAFTGLTAFWIGLHTVAVAPRRRTRVASAGVALSGAILASVARGDTGPFVVIIVAGLALLHLRPRRPDALWLATAAVAVAVGAWSFASAGQAAGVAPTVGQIDMPFTWVLGYDLTEILQVPAGVLGVGPWGSLGWVEVPMPTTVFVPLVALAGFLVMQGLGRLDRRKAAALALVGSALLWLPFYMLMRNLDTAGIQPRYFLSQVPFVLALCALLPGARTALRFTGVQSLFAWVCVTVAHSVALLTGLRRYTAGFGGSYVLGEDATWWWRNGPSPMQVWLVGSVAFGLGALALPLTASWRARRPSASASGQVAPNPDADLRHASPPARRAVAEAGGGDAAGTLSSHE